MSSESDHSSNVGENDDFSNDSESDHSSKDIENDDYLSDNEYDHSSKDNKNDDASSDSENDNSLKDENDDSSSDSENDNPLKDKNDDSSSDSENDNSLKDNNDESSSDSEKAHSSNVLECDETQSFEDKYEKLYSKDVTEFIAALKDTNQTMIEQILQKQTEKAEHDHNKNEPFQKYGALLKAACETKCFDSLKNIFKTVLSKKGSDKRRESEELQKLTYFYSEHCVGVEHDSVKTFKDDIVESLKSKISIYLKYAETGDRQPLWLTKVNFGNCTCGLCEGIIYFLNSCDDEKVLAVNNEQADHVLQCFQKQNKDVLSITTVRESNPHVFILRKNYSAIENWQHELAELENALRSITTGNIVTNNLRY